MFKQSFKPNINPNFKKNDFYIELNQKHMQIFNRNNKA